MLPSQTFDEIPADKERGPTILIVDDEELSQTRMQAVCASLETANEFQIFSATTIEEALEILARHSVQICFLDKNLGKSATGEAVNGIDHIPELLKLQPQLQILMVTGSKETEDIVRAMNLGALTYITKDSPKELIEAQVRRAVGSAALALTLERVVRQHPVGLDIDLVGTSPAMKRLKSTIPAVSESARPVLILGETGSGKTTVARAVHSYREKYLKQKGRPFFALNLGSMSPQIIERELFGNEAGAYTGAQKMKQGFFELSNHGTLFLDEIAEIPLDLQIKLLTVIETGKFFRVGGTRELYSSFKLICATNRDIEAMVRAGTFREDLFMRISTLIIRVPSLAERREDIPEIIRALLPRCCRENSVYLEFKDLPQDLIEAVTYRIPKGNIRGIEHLLSRLLVLAPKGKDGVPQVKQWRKIEGLFPEQARETSRHSISLPELMTLPLDVIGPDFPGIVKVMKSIEERILIDAAQKLHTNRKIAQALRVTESGAHFKLKGLRKSGLVGNVPSRTHQMRKEERDEKDSVH